MASQPTAPRERKVAQAVDREARRLNNAATLDLSRKATPAPKATEAAQQVVARSVDCRVGRAIAGRCDDWFVLETVTMKWAFLVVPKPLKFSSAEVGVPDGVPNVSMPEIRLNNAKILPALRQVIATGVPEHVRMYVEAAKASARSQSLYHQLNRAGGQLPTALRGKHEISRRGTIPAQLPQASNLQSAQRMIAGNTAFLPSYVEDAPLKVYIRPGGADGLLDAESMSPHHEQQGIIAHPVPILSCAFQQFFHFVRNEVFPISCPATRHCSLYGDWHHVSHSS